MTHEIAQHHTAWCADSFWSRLNFFSKMLEKPLSLPIPVVHGVCLVPSVKILSTRWRIRITRAWHSTSRKSCCVLSNSSNRLNPTSRHLWVTCYYNSVQILCHHTKEHQEYWNSAMFIPRVLWEFCSRPSFWFLIHDFCSIYEYFYGWILNMLIIIFEFDTRGEQY